MTQFLLTLNVYVCVCARSQIRCHADTHFAESIKNMKHEEFYGGIKCAHDLCYVSDACRHKNHSKVCHTLCTIKWTFTYILITMMTMMKVSSVWGVKSLLINKNAILRETETGRCASIKKHLNLRISHSSFPREAKTFILFLWIFLYKCANEREQKFPFKTLPETNQNNKVGSLHRNCFNSFTRQALSSEYLKTNKYSLYV